MAFAANLLENAMLVLARVAFAHFVMLHRRVFGWTARPHRGGGGEGGICSF